jgi:hypothetical protein
LTIRGAVPCRRRGQPAQPGAAPAAISNAEEAKATKAKADKLLNAGKISTAEHRLIQRAVDRVLNRESAPIEGKSAKARLDRPGRRMKREEGGRVQPELRSYEPTFRDKVARGLSTVIAGDEKLSPMQRRAVEA